MSIHGVQDMHRTDGDAAAARRAVATARARGRARTRSVVLALTLVTVLVCGAALTLGPFTVPVPGLVRSFTGGAEWKDAFFVREVRLPRVLTGALTGLAFGMSGAVFQGVVRNPLASPDVMGITSGAGAAAVVSLTFFGLGGTGVSLGALGGALATAALIQLLAWRRGVSGQRLVLVGIGTAAVLSSLTSYLMTSAHISDAQRALLWLTGSLNGRGTAYAGPLALCLAVLLPVTALLSRALGVLRLGDEPATGLGLPVTGARLGLLATGVALAAVATAAAGPVPFVALVAPPIARRLVREGPALTASALVGAVVMTASDLAARHLFGSTELPVGVVTGVVGAPYLLVLLATANRSGRSG
ncbi:iron chelate uptake ABC transporter family permease subunit [Streptomyces sp. NPDC049577]|uniref:FecCD family ABC transporter permease n=1 Tax=Streptomyces sp. NPDC049577 TaxID=3155153 RepID=UPI00343929F0